MQQRSLEELEEKIGYRFLDKQLLRQAVTHSSFANEQKINKYEDYERLEFWETPYWSLFQANSFFRRTSR